jgi:uncharacterized protein YaaN involved in tellurite resistance
MDENWKTVCALTEEEQNQAASFADGIDIMNLDQILHYGSACESMMEAFMDRNLLDLPSSAKGKIYQELENLRQVISSFNHQFTDFIPEDFPSVFPDAYQKTLRTVRHTSSCLTMYQKEIQKHMEVLAEAEELCLRIIRTYDMYILAGQLCLHKEQQKTYDTKGFIQANEAQDHQLAMDRLDRRLSALCVSQKVPEQTIGSIHLIQQDEHVLYESVGAINDHAFPLWQNGIMLAVNTHMEGNTIHYLDEKAFKDANTTLMQSLKKVMK